MQDVEVCLVSVINWSPSSFGVAGAGLLGQSSPDLGHVLSVANCQNLIFYRNPAFWRWSFVTISLLQVGIIVIFDEASRRPVRVAINAIRLFPNKRRCRRKLSRTQKLLHNVQESKFIADEILTAKISRGHAGRRPYVSLIMELWLKITEGRRLITVMTHHAGKS